MSRESRIKQILTESLRPTYLEIDDQKIDEIFYTFSPQDGQLLRIGRKRFYKFITS